MIERSHWEEEGRTLVKDMARSQKEPLRTIGGKSYYWQSDTYTDGKRIYAVRNRFVGFGNSIVLVTSGTLKGNENDPASQRVSESVHSIVESLREILRRRRAPQLHARAPYISIAAP